MRRLGIRRPLTAFRRVCGQGAGRCFGIVADSVPETYDRRWGVFAVARSEEYTVCQIDPDGSGVGNDAARVWVTVDEDFVLASRRRCDSEGKGGK